MIEITESIFSAKKGIKKKFTIEGSLQVLKYLETKQFTPNHQGCQRSKAKEQSENQPTSSNTMYKVILVVPPKL